IKNALPDMLKRVRAVSNLPQIGSISATSDIDYYARLMDHVEVQTFSTFAEFQRFVKLPADVLCLDGQSSVSLSYLDNILAMPELVARSNISVYTAYDVNTRWTPNSPVALRYAAFLKKWSAV